MLLKFSKKAIVGINYFFNGGGGYVVTISGNLYIPAFRVETNALDNFSRRIKKASSIDHEKNIAARNSIISQGSSTDLKTIPENCVDYIFIDPPFGQNIMYSEINFLSESWLKVIENNKDEAIINPIQNKGLPDYNNLVTQCMKEFFRILKPSRWMTVEFHNSKAIVWKSIQESIVKAGFIIAQVAVLDKNKGSFIINSSAGAVKHDLIINAYKPTEQFRSNFLKKAGHNLEKDFIEMHLAKLPIEPNIERTQQMLYSKLLSQYLQNGFEVRTDASEFYGLLRNHFTERDGYWFSNEQIPIYERRIKRAQTSEKFVLGQTVLGIDSEKTAIIWLTQFLRKPKTYNEIYIEFSKCLLTSEDKIPELKLILEENFTSENNKYRLPSDPEKKEKEDVRNRRLGREFQEIIIAAQARRKINDVRKEALLYGLIGLYNKKDVDQIRAIGKILDSRILESDDEIYAIIDWALSKDD